MYTPFGFTGASRPGLFNQQQQPNNFSGWDDRLSKIEQGIAGLTKQFSNFQAPGDVAPEYTGNAAPEPLEQTMNAPEPLELDSTAPPPIGGQANDPSWHGGRGGGQALSQSGYSRPIQPGQEGFNPLTAEQYAGQQDLWGQRQDYSNFSSMAGDVAGVSGSGIMTRFGTNPFLGHAYEDWQDYAAGYGGSDPSQGMENWMQDYNFDLAPERPQWQPGSGMNYQQEQLEYSNSPEYQAWADRQEARGPLSQPTLNAMGFGGGNGGPMGFNPINPSVMQGNTYDQYIANVNEQAANYVPQSTAIQRPVQGVTAASALQGPVQQQIQQGLGSLGAGI